MHIKVSSPAPTTSGVSDDATSDPISARRPASHRHLHAEQRRSQISDGHRLIDLARRQPFALYSAGEFATRAVFVDAAYWIDSVLPALSALVSRVTVARIDAALARSRKAREVYGVGRPRAAEAVTEALFDGKWFKTKPDHVGRAALRDKVARSIGNGEPVELVFPIFSRKPGSPLKNRGASPDVAELHSLVRFAALAHTVDALSPTGCRFTVLADGRKYNRACRTPDATVTAYQDTLREWTAELGASSVLHISDYEQWLREGLDEQLIAARDRLYPQWVDRLTATYTPLFDAADPSAGLARIRERDDIGRQLAVTFWSIATSVRYERFAGAADGDWTDGDRRAYAYYVASLPRKLSAHEWRRDIGGPADTDVRRLHRELRHEAWAAACRYVAISLTDRELELLGERSPRAVKLTIHGKPGELHMVTATSRDVNMTAQHSTGGYTVSGDVARPDYRYLVEREARGQSPVLVSGAVVRAEADARYRPLARLESAGQPIAYVDDTGPLLRGRLHQMFGRSDA
ncbi:L-tyrosine/L-tryptophan isonitrile synthase family protein [Streptomyces sp. NPDC001100]